ncbi:MAG: rod shape-determining protein [Candidatus Dojkabacteria bacterium]
MKFNIEIFQRPKLAVDFGTANCVIIHNRKGIVVREPTVVAISPSEKRVLAVGEEARVMLGKVPEGVEAKRPLKNGGISNYRLAEALLRKFFDRALGRVRLLKPEVIVCVPAGINSVEERAIIQAIHSVGGGRIYLLPEPVAASIGAKLPIHTAAGNLIVNIGGGTSEIAVLSLNGIVSYESQKTAGDAINDAIISYMKNKHNLIIGELTAENIKIKIASAVQVPLREDLVLEVSGKNSKTGQPSIVAIRTNELVEPIRAILNHIIEAIKRVLNRTPPEIMSDLIDRGMALSGGTAMLHGIDELFTKSIGIPAFVVEDPLTSVAKGLNYVLNNIDEFRRSVKIS